jgi:predicted aldo/keto reductase-like oxidoreductase
MHYKEFGKTGEKVSVLGFGAMRLPLVDEKDLSRIEEKEATEMVLYAVENGVNYFDTAWPYHGPVPEGGSSEPFLGKTLKPFRDRVLIATKLPSWFINEPKDMDYYLNKQLERLKSNTIDFYLLHALNRDYWEILLKCDVLKWLENVKKQGKIRHIGFSFHAALHTFKEIADACDWDFCQIQYNYLDEKYQAGREGLQYAADKGIGIVVMEPVRGGQLARNIPKGVTDLFAQAAVQRTPVEWALHWLWNQPEVDIVLGGMSTLEQLKQNVEYVDTLFSKTFTADDEETIEQVVSIYKEKLQVNCTGCNYCMPCPHNVDIPSNFTVLNNGYLTDSLREAKLTYKLSIPNYSKASACTECNVCIEHCPQELDIPNLMKRVVEELSE